MGSKSKAAVRKIVRRRSSPEERGRRVAEYKASGLTQREFSERIGVPWQTLSGWVRDAESGRGQSSPRSRKGRAVKAARKGRKPGPYSPEERRQAVEAYLASGMSQEEFGRVWGISGRNTLQKWVAAYQEQGPKALERGVYGRTTGGKRRGRAPLAVPVKQEIAQVKRANPEFGFKKIKNFLWRFRGVKVSTGSVRKTLIEEKLPPAPRPKRRPKRHKKVRRFERARAMQLWQSDITSYVLTRHGQRVYLTVFMDDHSRYVVAWGLNVNQKTELVTEALLDGIQRFGKPEEVLTDQGRQYYAWRGRSDFQRLLHQHGIRHVVSRAHHPQTLGKCERFWDTVAQELWERAKPQELSEARERLKHFIAHYNHFRPHQGIDGLVPADRFFGLESEVRKALEASLSQNELRLALGEAPRSPVFLVGQIGDQPLSLHGEAGRLVFQAPDGSSRLIESKHFGHVARDNPSPSPQPKESPHESVQDLDSKRPSSEAQERGDGDPSRVPGPAGSADFASDGDRGTGTGIPAEPHLEGQEAGLPAPGPARDPGQGTLADGHARAAGESPSHGNRTHGILAGSNHQGAALQGAPSPAASDLAVVPGGGVGPGGGASGPAQDLLPGDAHDAGREPEAVEKEDRGAGAHGGGPGPVDPDHPGASGGEAGQPAQGGARVATGAGGGRSDAGVDLHSSPGGREQQPAWTQETGTPAPSRESGKPGDGTNGSSS